MKFPVNLRRIQWPTKNMPLIFVSILMAFSFCAQAQIEGQWKDTEKSITILIYEQEGKYFGQLLSSEDAEQNKKIQENGKIVLLRDFKKKSDTKFCCGTIFQPKAKRTLDATLFLEDDKTLKIKASYGFFSGTKYWKRL
ncbi:DUF2147 domain-containing protein [Cyclobacterium sp. SYSU L10401]|uniref:DUF2147 domain-containing protein n=1 Tax=Cyclobacterium sp. SYSU L10401 TaxID=2678657 RepID=UPI0013D557DC|nr:DUF2147 domain-containing protein [Cyclobacterium sp. SYSU L10401]